MIEFATLLIGLLVGPRQVEMSVQGPVAVVEVWLDGRLVERLEQKPWVVEVDFGDRLVPHRLTASAFDGQGAVLDTTTQIVNYSRPSFEAAIVLDASNSRPDRGGRVIWQGALDVPPREIVLTFDGRELAIDPAGRFTVPDHDPTSVHVLEAAVTFADGSIGIASLTFGGQFIEQTDATLTAIPVSSAPHSPWTVEQVRGWLTRGGRELEVFTVTVPTGIAVVLRDDRIERATRAVLPWREQMARSRYSSAASTAYRVMAICPRPFEGSPNTFRLSHPTGVNPRYGLRRILLHEGPLVPNKKIDGRKLVKKGQKLWDSLAVAGLKAARRNVPRLVILMISDRLEDSSRLTARQAVEYLRSIHVPLLLWAPHRRDLETLGLSRHESVHVGAPGLRDLELAVGRELASQTIVWVEGEHLPSEITLGPAAPDRITLPH